MHGSSEAAALAAKTPAQVTPPPRGHRNPRGESQQVDRQAPVSPRNPAPSRRGAESLRKIPGPHGRPPRLVLPSPAWPDGEHAPLAETTLRRRPQGSTGSRRGCDSRRLPGLPREKEGSACSCRPLPQGLRRVWASPTSTRERETRWTCPWGAGPAGERRTSTASSHTSYPTEQRRTASRCAACDRQERVAKERHGSSWTTTELPETAQTRTTRHDTIVCVCLRLSRELSPELEIKTHSHLHDQNQKPDTWPSTSAGP
ncbi:Hypothetical protein GSB_151138 [Giardia duodenalis]|uniref:Uncharacterized protein n=1 Tax=Giardia intestinalis TaxID=5741 RepID=V6TXX2_GIAIN|nr:Hypothetical protein GSB_151138 [Giardia intestinalis]